MGNNVKVAVFRIRTVKMQNSYATSDNDIYPCFGTATTTYRVYLSKDISNDMPVAQSAVKGISDKVTTETLELTADSPSVDINNSKQFSEELSSNAADLLSAALPEYTFSVAEYPDNLKYDIAQNALPQSDSDITAGRLKVMGCLLAALVISAIIPYHLVPWASFAVASVYTMFIATILYCLLTWLIARIVNADKIGLSIGIVPRICLYRFKTVDIFCGPVPFPDLSMPESVMQKHSKSWTIATIPPILLILLGVAFIYYRNYLFVSSPDAVAYVLQCHFYSVVALLSLSCFLTAVVALLIFFEKSKDIYPHCTFLFTIIECVVVVAGISLVNKYNTEILNFITA